MNSLFDWKVQDCKNVFLDLEILKLDDTNKIENLYSLLFYIMIYKTCRDDMYIDEPFLYNVDDKITEYFHENNCFKTQVYKNYKFLILPVAFVDNSTKDSNLKKCIVYFIYNSNTQDFAYFTMNKTNATVLKIVKKFTSFIQEYIVATLVYQIDIKTVQTIKDKIGFDLLYAEIILLNDTKTFNELNKDLIIRTKKDVLYTLNTFNKAADLLHKVFTYTTAETVSSIPIKLIQTI